MVSRSHQSIKASKRQSDVADWPTSITYSVPLWIRTTGYGLPRVVEADMNASRSVGFARSDRPAPKQGNIQRKWAGSALKSGFEPNGGWANCQPSRHGREIRNYHSARQLDSGN